ncbi:MAG: radical SAM protein [Lentisphaerae bacterium]|nr:radical SAM protein [Lentisphaerota bacterium]
MSARLPPRLRAYGHVLHARLAPASAPRRPHAAHILITWRCNLRCGGCDAWQRPPGSELDAGGWARVFSRLPFLDIVKIIGGEPFAREDLPEIVVALRREIDPFVVQLVTNASLTDRILAFVDRHAWPGLHLRVSLDGLRETHDRSRGHAGAFDRAVETLRGLSRLRKTRRFQVGVNFTMTDDSVGEMPGLSELCRSLGVDVVPGFKVKPFLRDCDIRKERAQTINLVDRQRALDRLAEMRHGAASGFNPVERFFLRALNQVVFRKHAAGGNAVKFRCGELRDLMYLNPSGELMTCGLNQKPLGSLVERDFDDVWFSEPARAARRQVVDCPGCMQGAVEIMSKLYA